MLARLVNTSTTDGVRLHGALLTPTGYESPKVDVVMTMHGVGGNFYGSNIFSNLAPAIQSWGAHVLLTNNRGHDGLTKSPMMARAGFGAAYEIVDESRLDIRAWLEFLTAEGFRRVVLFGHSLGAVKSIYSMARECFPEVKGIFACSPPCLSYQKLVASSDASEFLANIARAKEYCDRGEPNQLLDVRFPFPLIISAAAYLEKYGPTERYNFLVHTPQLKIPVKFCYGELELTRPVGAFNKIDEDIKRLGQQQSNLSLAIVPMANHFYTNSLVLLEKELLDWLNQTFAS